VVETNSIEKNPWESNIDNHVISPSDGQDIPHRIWSPEVYYMDYLAL
jgi:hypothetical protein